MPLFAYKTPYSMKPFSSPLKLQVTHQKTIIIYLSFSSMAKNMVMRLDSNGNKSKAYHALGLFCLMLLMQKSSARDFPVGGSKGAWGVPADNTTLSYNQWAEKNRFQIGDSLVFNYASGQDSVLEVNKDAYNDCSTDNPIAKYTDGHTVYTFKKSGPHYFISGNKSNCLNNEKLVVVVLADRSNGYSNSTQTSPSSPPSPSTTDVVTPAPAPAGEYPPPEGTVEVNPTPAPQAPPSAASSTFISLVSSFGAFAASSLLLAF